MRLDLTQINVFVLNCPGQVARRQQISAQCNQVNLSFEIVEGIRCSPGFMGCSLSHLKLLSRPDLKAPFLVLEDDCAVSRDFQRILMVPDAADLVYLGHSTWGITPERPHRGTNHATRATRYDDAFLQIHNMLSSHALLYLSTPMLEAIRARTLQYILKEMPFDIGLARLQQEFLVLTPNRPFFYQDGAYGGAEAATRISLRPVSQ